MTGKRAENVLEIRAYIKGRSLLGITAVYIHREVCDIYGEGQMSHRTVCMWVAKFSAGQQHLKDAARPGRPATTTTKGNIEKNPKYPQSWCMIHRKTIGSNDKLVFSKSSCNFEE